MTTDNTTITIKITDPATVRGARGEGLRAFIAHRDDSPQERVAAMLATGAFESHKQAVAFHNWYLKPEQAHYGLVGCTPHPVGRGGRVSTAAGPTPTEILLMKQLAALQAALEAGGIEVPTV